MFQRLVRLLASFRHLNAAGNRSAAAPAPLGQSMPLDTPIGAKVRFVGTNGIVADREFAGLHLVPTALYTVAYIDVGTWRSTVEFKEAPGYRFNTVLFAPAEPRHQSRPVAA
jgi:hypothetical protein